jgi:hypothetical protein
MFGHRRSHSTNYRDGPPGGLVEILPGGVMTEGLVDLTSFAGPMATNFANGQSPSGRRRSNAASPPSKAERAKVLEPTRA